MDRALAELVVEGPGVHTTAALHRAMLRHPDFRADRHDVQFLDRELPGLLETVANPALSSQLQPTSDPLTTPTPRKDGSDDLHLLSGRPHGAADQGGRAAGVRS